MNRFLFKILVFFSLWVSFYFFEDAFPSTMALLLTILIIGGYFFIAAIKKKLLLYVGLNIFTMVLYIFIAAEQNFAGFLFLLFFAIEAIETLNNQEYKLYIIISFLLFAIFSIVAKQFAIEPLGVLSLFYFVCVKSNELTQATVEQKHLYSELLGEYRTLKRQAFLAEKEARYEERTKIARDLHDSVGHKITALLMQLEILFHQHGAEKYKELKKLANESLQETRKAVKALSHEEQEGFSTILHLIKKLESESHILVQLTTKGGVLSTKLTNVESVVLYRVIQEGLTNAMRHANSREVQVILGKNPVGEIEFAIMNKVHGVETFQEGFGIKSMRERVLSLGGSLSVYIASDQFIVKGQFPVQDHNQ